LRQFVATPFGMLVNFNDADAGNLARQ